MLNYILILASVLFIYMSMWYVLSLIKKRNDIADIAWGLGFMLMTWLSFVLGSEYSNRGLLLGLLISIWGIRLSLHIYTRNKGRTEDYRYLEWRKTWGKWFYIRSYLQIYILQGILLFIIVSPVIFVNKSVSADLNYIDFIGVAVWIIGFIFESLGDSQLAVFIKDPANKGKLMKSGLWRYTRHPNYFGEVTMWWGVFIIACALPGGYYTVIGPLTITYLILFVSGIPMLEKKYIGRADFEEYKKQTSIFLPLPPKNNDK